MKISKLIYYLPYAILIITFYSILPYPRNNGNIIVFFDNTMMWWGIRTIILLGFYMYYKIYINKTDKSNMRWIFIYFLWNIIEDIRGIFIAENYWDWKGLVNNMMILAMPIMAYIATNIFFVQKTLSIYMRFALPFFIFVLLFIATDAYGFYLVPIGFLIFFLPLMKRKWQIILLSFVSLVLLVDFDARSNVIKFAIPIFSLLLIPFKRILSVKLFEIVRKFMFLLPVILFALAVSGIFNVFKMQEYIGGDHIEKKKDANGQVVEADLTADTRTFIYVEVLHTAQKYNTWWLGRSPARGNETDAFADLKEISGRKERLSNEVAITNIFTWTGIVGVVLYGLIFYTSSYQAINKSKNFYAKLLGLFIIFRWAYAWVEDINNFSLNYMFIWFIIGLCYSQSFRQMTDHEVKIWVRGIFDYRYRAYFRKQKKFIAHA